MTYNVVGGTLNLTQSINLPSCCFITTHQCYQSQGRLTPPLDGGGKFPLYTYPSPLFISTPRLPFKYLSIHSLSHPLQSPLGTLSLPFYCC